MNSNSDTIIGFRAIGHVRGDDGRIFPDEETAWAACEADGRNVRIGHPGSGAYSDRTPVPVPLDEALQEDRVPWTLIEDAGVDIGAVAAEARMHGDEQLYRRARAALHRRQ